jgi:hypothetical protein
MELDNKENMKFSNPLQRDLLSDKEKKLLTALHGAKLKDWEFYPHYKEFLEEYISFSGLDLREIVKRFVDLGLLEVIDLGNGVVKCRHTDKVTRNMLDEELVYYGNDYGFENTQ